MSFPGSPLATLPPSVPTYLGALQLVLGSYGPDDKGVAAKLNAFQLDDAADVDKVLGRREAKLHHGYQTLPARQYAAIVAVLVEEDDCLRDRLGTVVGEGGRDHGHTPVDALARGKPRGHNLHPPNLRIAAVQLQIPLHQAHQ